MALTEFELIASHYAHWYDGELWIKESERKESNFRGKFKNLLGACVVLGGSAFVGEDAFLGIAALVSTCGAAHYSGEKRFHKKQKKIAFDEAKNSRELFAREVEQVLYRVRMNLCSDLDTLHECVSWGYISMEDAHLAIKQGLEHAERDDEEFDRGNTRKRSGYDGWLDYDQQYRPESS